MTDEEYLDKARELWQQDGDIEIDDDAGISRSAHTQGDESLGAYVQAWVWVPEDEEEVTNK